MKAKASSKTKISIISAVKDCRDETAAFLKSLRKHGPAEFSELILIDDGSGEETRKYLRGQSRKHDYLLLTNAESRGFAFSNNRGAGEATGDWLLFLNNDLILTKDWFSSFAKAIAGKARLASPGCIGNLQIDPRTEKIDHAGVTFKTGIPRHHLLGKTAFPKARYSEWLAVTGACMLIKRDLFLKAGGFDESYRTGFEDTDLCLRLRLLGFRHYVANQSQIYHKRGSSVGRNEHAVHNSKLFYGRWGHLITRFGEWDLLNTEGKSLSPEELTKHKASAASVREKDRRFLFADFALLIKSGRGHLARKQFGFADNIGALLGECFPDQAETWGFRGMVALRMDALEEAEAYFGRAAKMDPSTAKHRHNLGETCRQAGQSTAAIRHFRRALKISPDHVKSHYNLGLCLMAQEKRKLAEKAFRQAILFDSLHAKTWRKLGELHQEAGRSREAVRAFRQFLRLVPKDRQVRGKLAELHEAMDRPQEALGVLLEGSKGSSLEADGMFAVGRLSYDLGRFKQAETWLLRCLESDDFNWQAWHYLGNAHVGMKNFPGAVEAYKRALEINPGHPTTFNNLANCRTFLCDWSCRDEDMENIRVLLEHDRLAVGAFELGGLSLSNEESAQAAKRKASDVLAKTDALRKRLRFTFARRRPGRSRVGFLSSDLRNHAVGHLFAGLLARIDGKRFEIFVYSTGPDDASEVREKIGESAEHFRDLSRASLVKKAQCIHRDDLDLLIDLGGHSLGANPELLALRPARRQAHYLGYAGSLGPGLTDYQVADEYVLPKTDRKNYAEEISNMPGPFLPPGETPAFSRRLSRKAAGLPAKGFVFCAFHAAYKLEPEIFDAWMRILKAVPDSVLWLKFKPAEDAMNNLRNEAVRRGIPSKRLLLADDLPAREKHLARMSAADLFLDCPQYNAHATAIDALQAGVPILTLEGTRFCSRVAGSLLNGLGLDGLIRSDLDDYVAKAIKLAESPAELKKLRRAIKMNRDNALCPEAHAKRFEQSLRSILRKKPSTGFIAGPSGKKKSSDKKKPAKADTILSLLFVRNGDEGSKWMREVERIARENRRADLEVVVIEEPSAKHLPKSKDSEVRRLKAPPSSSSRSALLNFAVSQSTGDVICLLDDPARIIPGKGKPFFRKALDRLEEDRLGLLAVGANPHPEASCLVAAVTYSSGRLRAAGIEGPCLFVKREVFDQTGGLDWRNFPGALSLLDLSLRAEQANFCCALISSGFILPSSRTAQERISSAEKQTLHGFRQRWQGTPSPLLPQPTEPTLPAAEKRSPYESWIAANSWTAQRGKLWLKRLGAMKAHPMISVIMPVYNPKESLLRQAVESVLSQVYKDWELCIADDCSTDTWIAPYLEDISSRDPRIKVVSRSGNGGIACATNSAIGISKGEFLAFLDHDDLLEPDALAEVAWHLQEHPDTDFLYTDDDKIDEAGARFDPQFKPDWSPELLLSYCYVCHLKVARASVSEEIGHFREGYDGSQDYDYVLRLTEKCRTVGHIPKILYHWRATAGSTARDGAAKPGAFQAGRKAVKETCERRSIAATVRQPGWAKKERLGIFEMRFPDQGPEVTILVPTRNNPKQLQACLKSLEKTTYENFSVTIIDNASDDPEAIRLFEQTKHTVSRVPNPGKKFNFSHLVNQGVEQADTPYVLLLNDDTEAVSPRWLSQMVGFLGMEGVAAVGAKLLFPNKTIQHAGIIHGLGGGLAGPAFRNAARTDPGYMNYLRVPRNYSAVTAACLLTTKKVFMETGGFDETQFAVAYNDVDFGYRLIKSGKRCVYCPDAELIHREGSSRGFSDNPSELGAFKRKYRCFHDPYYNPNLSLNSDRFEIIPRRLAPPGLAPPRVLAVTHNLNHEGAPICLFEMLAGLVEKKAIHLSIVSLKDGPLRAKYEKLGVEVRILSFNYRRIDPLLFSHGLTAWAGEVAIGSYDLVCANTLDTFFAIEAAARAEVPSIWNIHESLAATEGLPRELKQIVPQRAHDSFKHPYRMVFSAEATARDYGKWNSRHNFCIVRPAFNPARFKGKRLKRNASLAKVPKGDKVILCVGTICERKGQMDLVRAFEELPAEQLRSTTLVLLGKPHGKYGQKVIRKIRNNPLLCQKAILPGSQPDPSPWYELADLYVCPSFVESYPLTILEAMHFGLPIIATEVFGIPEQVIEGQNALLFSPGDVAGLCNHMKQLLADEALCKSMAAASPEVLGARYSFEDSLDSYHEIFLEAASYNTLTAPTKPAGQPIGEAYRKHYDALKKTHGRNAALGLTVGGRFEEVGQQEVELLNHFGLEENDFVVDVGCGCGRLAIPLSLNHKGGYLGTDVVPELLAYAKSQVKRKDWQFAQVDDLVIPARDRSVDLVCFFSVFTHLDQAETLQYLKEAMRVLKPEGRIVFSFLNLEDPGHRKHVQNNAGGLHQNEPVNAFMDHHSIRTWAKMLGAECRAIIGHKEKLKDSFPAPSFEQSIAMWMKPKGIRADTHEEIEHGQASGKATVKRLMESFPILPNETVLEIGCGIGRIGRELAPRCKKWIGCEVSPKTLALAKDRLAHLNNVELIELAGSDLGPLPDASIDVVYCSVVFMHLEERDRFAYVKEAFRVLRKGGRFYADNFNPSIAIEEGSKLFMQHHELSKDERPPHVSQSSTPNEIQTYLRQAGFGSINLRTDDSWVWGSGIKQ